LRCSVVVQRPREGNTQLSKAIGLASKADGIDGSQVERLFHEGRIKEIANYCVGDVINTYRIWLRYELFRGKLTQDQFEVSEVNLASFMQQRNTTITTLTEIKAETDRGIESVTVVVREG